MNSERISVIFFGTPKFAANMLQALIDNKYAVKAVVTQTDKPSGRGKVLTASPVKQCAERYYIPVLQPARIKKNLDEFLNQAKELGPYDIGVVAAFGQILPEAVLQLPRKGCVNVHASLLPRWRGAAPIQRALMSGDTRTGVCLMKMDPGLDTGPIFASREVEIIASDTFGTLHDKLAHAGADLLNEKLSGICDGSLFATPQPGEGVTYAQKLGKEDEEIDWSRNSVEVWNLIRALSPFPGAYTILQGKRLKILEVEPIQEDTALTSCDSGVILSTDKRTLYVGCGRGSLSVKTVQPEGKRKMTVTEWLPGAGLRTGMRMGRA